MTQIHITDDKKLQIMGELTFSTVRRLDESLKDKAVLLQVSVDLSKTQRCDSAGLALLVSWYRQALKQNKMLPFENIPERLLKLANVSGVDKILGLAP